MEYIVQTIGGCDGCIRRCGDTTVGSFDNYEEALTVARKIAEAESLFTRIENDGEIIWTCEEDRWW